MDKTWIKEQWFGEHKGFFDTIENKHFKFESLIWQKPGTICYSISYLIKGNTLIVTGDLGDAIYKWSSALTFEWLAGLDLQYFHGKCVASGIGGGSKNYDWDEDKAIERVREHFADAKDCKGYKAFLNQNPSFDSRQELADWCSHTNHLTDLLGDDWWEWLCSSGNEIPSSTESHLIGIKMAMEQKKAQEG